MEPGVIFVFNCLVELGYEFAHCICHHVVRIQPCRIIQRPRLFGCRVVTIRHLKNPFPRGFIFDVIKNSVRPGRSPDRPAWPTQPSDFGCEQHTRRPTPTLFR
jgi:hypothetical protein